MRKSLEDVDYEMQLKIDSNNLVSLFREVIKYDNLFRGSLGRTLSNVSLSL